MPRPKRKQKAEKAKAKAKAKAAAKGKPGLSMKQDKQATKEAQAVELPPTVAERSEKAGSKALLKLAAREDVIASGKSYTAMLKALEESNGLLHPAKRALLGA